MFSNNSYDILVIGGGVSACVFSSFHIKNGFVGKIAIVEAGRKLGGRSSTRTSHINKGWELSHGSPNFNITNISRDTILEDFIKKLVEENIIKSDTSELINLNKTCEIKSKLKKEFYRGKNYIPKLNMTNLSEDIISLYNTRNQIDFYYGELITNLEFKENKWILTTNKGNIYHSKFIVISSNLLIHKRCLDILKTKSIPLRNAIPFKSCKKLDQIINLVNKQDYIQRLTFLIYTKANYYYKDNYLKKYRTFLLDEFYEEQYKFERIIFQKQKNKKLGIVIHTRNMDVINNYIESKNEDFLKINILSSFNELFYGNPLVNQIIDYQDISIMRWRASQPKGTKIPTYLQVCEEINLGFCGDWFDFEGFGRIQGAITSAINLSLKINSFS